MNSEQQKAQADRNLYRQAVRQLLDKTPNLHLFQSSVDDLCISNNKVSSVKPKMELFFMPKIILTTGTFLMVIISANKIILVVDLVTHHPLLSQKNSNNYH